MFDSNHLRRNGTASLVAGLALAVAACGGAEVEPGPTPDPGPGPTPPGGEELTVEVSPHSGTVETDVTVRAGGFEPGARVRIGFGPPASEYEVVGRATAGDEGAVTTSVNVPDWAEAGRAYVFVAVAPDGEDVISSEFDVTSGQDEGGDTIRVVGTLTDEGVECPALRSESGELYTLAGDTGRFEAGDRVEVKGTVAEMSTCMQGTTLELHDISDAG